MKLGRAVFFATAFHGQLLNGDTSPSWLFQIAVNQQRISLTNKVNFSLIFSLLHCTLNFALEPSQFHAR